MERVLKVCDDWETDPKTKIIFTSLIHEICDLSRHCKEMMEASEKGDECLGERIQHLDAKIVTALADLTREVSELRDARIKDDGGNEAFSRMAAVGLTLGAALLASITTAIATYLL